MARLFKQEYIKTRVVRDADGNPVKLPNGGYCREPMLDGKGKPVKGKARRWTVEYTDDAGKRRRKVGYVDKSATEQLAADLEKRAARKAIGWIDDTVEQAVSEIGPHLDDYRGHLRAKGVTEEHLEETTGRIQRMLNACGFARLVDIKPTPVERFLCALVDGSKDQPSRSARTRNTYLISLRAFVHWAVKTKRLEYSTLEGIDLLNEEVDQRRPRRAFTPEELVRLVRAAMDRPRVVAKFLHHMYGRKLDDADREHVGRERALIYKTLALTGMRENELRELRWSDLDLDAGWVDIRAETAKSSVAESIPLRDDLVADLRDWWVRCGRPAPSAAVFRVPRLLCRLMRKDLAHAGIPYKTADGYVDVHALRHTTGTCLTTHAAVPTRVAQDFMRHSDIRLTAHTYTDGRLVDKRRALVALPDVPLDPPATPNTASA